MHIDTLCLVGFTTDTNHSVGKYSRKWLKVTWPTPQLLPNHLQTSVDTYGNLQASKSAHKNATVAGEEPLKVK